MSFINTFNHEQVDLVSTVQGRIRTLLSETDAKRINESLTDIDVYITVKMAEAKQVTLSSFLNVSIYLNCKIQIMLMSSVVVQIM